MSKLPDQDKSCARMGCYWTNRMPHLCHASSSQPTHSLRLSVCLPIFHSASTRPHPAFPSLFPSLHPSILPKRSSINRDKFPLRNRLATVESQWTGEEPESKRNQQPTMAPQAVMCVSTAVVTTTTIANRHPSSGSSLRKYRIICAELHVTAC